MNYDKIVAILHDSRSDFSEKTISYCDDLYVVRLFYIKQLIDKAALIEAILKPLILHCSQAKQPIIAHQTLENIIYVDDCHLESDMSKIEAHILNGKVIILFSTDSNYLVVNIKKVEHREVPVPNLTYTTRGPQDCFNENLDVNISLIRYRNKDKNLRIDRFEVGVRTKTRIAVIYIEDIANNTVVSEIKKRIKKINVDGIGESGELQSFLLNNKLQLFPQVGLVERSDMAANSLLGGKVLVLCEGSGIGLIAPKTFNEFFHSGDDVYDNKFIGLFMRILRYTALIIALTSSSLFVAITTYHANFLPSNYVLMLAKMRVNVPFPSVVGALLLEFIVELLREALLRVPKQIGPAIGIVGAIVIGQAAISAGIFSPLLLIIVSISLLASFAMPDYTLVNPFRILKFILIIITGALGFYGFDLFITVILIELVSLNSFGVPYFAPWAPFNLYDFIRTFISNTTINPKRSEFLRTKDKTRLK